MAEALANTIRYLEEEITRLRNKRMKIPFENVELGEMQKTSDEKRDDDEGVLDRGLR